jgi:phage terminase small subunit
LTKKRTKAGSSKAGASARHALFVEAYLQNGGNATQAAISAGYSPKTAKQQGARLLTHVDVSTAVEKRRAETLATAAAATQLTVNEVLEDLAQAKRFDPALLFDDKGVILPVHKMPPEVRLQLEGVKYDQIVLGRGKKRRVINVISDIRFPKKSTARDQAMKHLGLYKADNEQKLPTEEQVEHRIAELLRKAGANAPARGARAHPIR